VPIALPQPSLLNNTKALGLASRGAFCLSAFHVNATSTFGESRNKYSMKSTQRLFAPRLKLAKHQTRQKAWLARTNDPSQGRSDTVLSRMASLMTVWSHGAYPKRSLKIGAATDSSQPQTRHSPPAIVNCGHRHNGRRADLRCKREPSVPRGWKPTFTPPQTGLGAGLPQVSSEPRLSDAAQCTKSENRSEAAMRRRSLRLCVMD
jgi:hypothetical protein